MLSVAIEEFLQWRARHYRPNTVKNSETALRLLMQALGDLPVDEINRDDGERIIAYLHERQQASTVNQNRTVLQAFFKWLVEEGYVPLTFNPFRNIRPDRVPQKDYPRLTVDEFEPFLDSATSPRDRIFCALGLYLFLRGSEAASLRVRDLRLGEGTLTVTVHKTNDIDVMPLNTELDRELRRWLTHMTSELGPLDPDWYLVPAFTASRFTQKLAPTRPISKPEAPIKRTLEAYGWEDTYWAGAHLLRRSGARCLFDELCDQAVDASLRIVSSQLHHKNVAMTERYLGITADRARRDRLLKGANMFTRKSMDNVITLRGVAQ